MLFVATRWVAGVIHDLHVESRVSSMIYMSQWELSMSLLTDGVTNDPPILQSEWWVLSMAYMLQNGGYYPWPTYCKVVGVIHGLHVAVRVVGVMHGLHVAVRVVGVIHGLHVAEWWVLSMAFMLQSQWWVLSMAYMLQSESWVSSHNVCVCTEVIES